MAMTMDIQKVIQSVQCTHTGWSYDSHWAPIARYLTYLEHDNICAKTFNACVYGWKTYGKEIQALCIFKEIRIDKKSKLGLQCEG